MSLVSKIASIIETASNCIKDKKLFASTETLLARATICDACEHLKYCYGSTKKAHCEKCGCGLFTKISISGSVCPIGRW